MKIPANWRKPNWKSWGRKVWQKARVYAVLIGVVALGVGIYGAYLLRELPKWQTETIAAAANVISSEIPEIYKVADSCMVLYKGRVNAVMGREEMTEKNVMYYSTGANVEGAKNA